MQLTTFLSLTGTYQCNKHRSKTSTHVTHGQKTFQALNGQTLTINDFIKCLVLYLVYGLSCTCGKIYGGNTIRPMRNRFGMYPLSVGKGLLYHSVSRHFAHKHKNSYLPKVFGIQSTAPKSRNMFLLQPGSIRESDVRVGFGNSYHPSVLGDVPYLHSEHQPFRQTQISCH